jgi:cob(I)alamin adenosyltransferase
MLASSSNNYLTINNEVVNINKNKESKSRKINHNGQIQIYQSSYRGSYSSIIRDSLRNAALGRKVLLVQLMKGGVKQGISNAQNLCGNLTWIRSSNSYDLYESENINKNISESINNSIIELWNFCKRKLLYGDYDQIILDEVFLAVEMNIIGKDDLISTLENRFITGDVILTGTSIPKNFLLMADQITALRS